MQRLYFDHNATSPLRPEARAELERWLDAGLGNPSSVHGSGRRARSVIDEARERVAAALGVREGEVVFTSGGTEAIGLALRGAAAKLAPGTALATTTIEHAAVLEHLRALRDGGHPLLELDVDGEGRLDVERAARACAELGAGLLSVGVANNEIGVVQDLAGLRAALERAGVRPVVHTDAVQALGRLPIDLEQWGAQLATFSAHKVGGPVGVGVLVARGGAALEPVAVGGGQEMGFRAGTESAAAIAAAGVAIELAVAERAAYAERVEGLARRLWAGLEAGLVGARLLGPAFEAPDARPARLPNTVNVLTDQGGDLLLARLDLEGVEASAGSACASGSIEPSHVLLALGLDESGARRGLRLSLGPDTTAHDVEQLVDIVCRTCASLVEKQGTTGGAVGGP
ncbi:Cysteine desulfurase [Planctomycetes bacterium Pla163]|uniref:Cysteine desulfurase n=1 Tax=Rohdeia mirabilis TaxID=2528008 RepID=A0A518D594_9BACT|nr:Cysteine desulfurase [Planctomycetes bacterium Pla163]